ncbi:MAG: hypothetical protein HY791_16285 [Deltaproteobacteria bacterium]|nr:hypothetical protein [Deltaproteobacteria bacterium]
MMNPRLELVGSLIAAMTLAACVGDDDTPDSAVADVGTQDATPHPDAVVDAGFEDAAADAGVDATVDVGFPDATPTDLGPVDTGLPPADLALLYAYSGDGIKVVAEFSEALAALSVEPGAFELQTAGADIGVQITDIQVSGATVTMTLASALPTGDSYDVVALTVEGQDGSTLDPEHDRAPLHGKLNVAIIWHQHQPSYVDPKGDYLRGPWVRKHGTKDYYDMVAMVGDYPDIHVQVNLTPILLMQLENYYLARIGPFVDLTDDTVDVAGYFAQGNGTDPVTDPWIDLLLRPTPDPAALTEVERGWFYEDIWSNFSISEVMIGRFPAYQQLLNKRDAAPETFTQDELLQMKGWFQLAWFDPDFLRGPVTMPDGQVVDLSDLVTEQPDGKFVSSGPFTEEICQRLVVEEYRVLSNVVAAHRELIYDPVSKTGQVEVMTTPFFHPILPLIHDTELAKVAMPSAALPGGRFQRPEDARFHVNKAALEFQNRFGQPVTGMWPAEGSVAEDVLPYFAQAGVKWLATDIRVLQSSTPPNLPNTTPYRIDLDGVVGDGGDATDELAIVFRDTAISDEIGFHYQGNPAARSVADFHQSLRRHTPIYGQDHLLSVILDGENAWEWYRQDNDAKGFLNGMYQLLTDAQESGELRTVTVSEYLSGNAARQVPAHPVSQLPELEPLWAGSWIDANYAIWIGEDEENLAWDYLIQVRSDLEGFESQGLLRPLDTDPVPAAGTPEWHAYQAWMAMYAAEGSDWFWWYGSDQTAVGGDEPFDRIYRELLSSVYRHAAAFGLATEVPDFPPILRVCIPPAGPIATAPLLDGQFDPDYLDGNLSTPHEWRDAGAGVCVDPDSGAAHLPDDVIEAWYHGVKTGDGVYVALRMSDDLTARLGTDYQVRLYFSQKHIVSLNPTQVEQDPFVTTTRAGTPITFAAGGAAREVTLDFSSGVVTASVAAADVSGWLVPVSDPTVQLALGARLIELRVPFASVSFQANDPLEMLMTITAAGEELDRAPNLNSLVLSPDRSTLVEVTLILDATGSRLPLEFVKPIDNPPPPEGTGRAFIVGNLPEIGSWVPNTVSMVDDGATLGDTFAGDNYWTFQMFLPPLTGVQYKYTIGTMGDGWGPTEEYPLTNRGFVVRDTDSDGKVVVRDVFADRPNPSGGMGALSTFDNP